MEVSKYRSNDSVEWSGAQVFYMILGSIQERYLEAIMQEDVMLAAQLLLQEYLHIIGFDVGKNLDKDVKTKIETELFNAVKTDDREQVQVCLFDAKRALSIFEANHNMKVNKRRAQFDAMGDL